MAVNKISTIWFVCKANKVTGLGHLIRCISLANGLVKFGKKVNFYGDFSNQAQKLLNIWNLSFTLDNKSISELLKKLPFGSQVILDSYQYASSDLKPSHSYVLIDDFCRLENYPVVGVINFTLMAHLYDYKKKGAHFSALGPEYFLPNPALKKPIYTFQSTIKNVLILIGSGDKLNLVTKIISALNYIQQPLNLRVITPKKFNGKTHHALEILPIQSNIEPHYRWADFCITSGGLAKYEAAYLGKPATIISLTKLEQGETEHFSRKKLCFDFGLVNNFNSMVFSKRFDDLLKCEAVRREAFNNCLNIFSADSRDNAVQFVCYCFSLRSIVEV
ncbi:MAG: hypothetical protein H9855_15550 [Candidatus Acinetobacter avistercoris]|nr:hypothetical protein [Candidatus Acinetobacter avistercoris]